MTNENKQLLLIDLCARLPYLVKGLYQWKGNVPFDRELDGRLYNELYLSLYSTEDSSFKPYLRPMSSMTEEEEKEYYDLTHQEDDDVWAKCLFDKMVDFCYERHLDFRGLIPMGLAIEAPEGMYKTE